MTYATNAPAERFCLPRGEENRKAASKTAEIGNGSMGAAGAVAGLVFVFLPWGILVGVAVFAAYLLLA